MAQPDDPLYSWYFEHVVVGGRPAKPGPAMRRQLAWQDIADGLRGTSPLVDLALSQGFVATTRQAYDLGVTMADIRRLVRREVWTAPRRGVVCVVPPGEGAAHPHGLSLEVRASALALVTGTAIGSECAASAFGLPLLEQPARARVTAPSRHGSGRATALLRPAGLSPQDRTSWFGATITTVARTVVDLARHSDRAGLVAADAALHENLCSLAELRASAGRSARWPGVRTARQVVELACADAESPLESLSRLALSDATLPLPHAQTVIETPWGTYRVDGLWRDRAVVLETDGMLKYRDLDPADRASALTAEKRRQEHLERDGYRVVRVTWDDLENCLDETIGRITWALRLGGSRLAAERRS